MIRTVVFISICVFVLSCSGGRQVAVEQPPVPGAVVESTPVRLQVAPAPRLGEVEDAVKRVFKDAAVLDPQSKPNFVSGDFNGDASQDLAVVLKPAPGKVAAMNEQYAPWLLRDPRSNQVDRRQPLRIDDDERLLAVIHGNGVNDWRDPGATQTFVLKNVAGNDLRVQSGADFAAANTGRKLPRPQGDLIGETLQGTPGYLYYSTSTYSWYDPKTFNAQPQAPGVFHKSRTMRAHAALHIGRPQSGHTGISQLTRSKAFVLNAVETSTSTLADTSHHACTEDLLLGPVETSMPTKAETSQLGSTKALLLGLVETSMAAQAKMGAARDGFAAGCEARLRLAGNGGLEPGLSPWFGLWPTEFRAEPEPGAQPLRDCGWTARHSLASHRAAEPSPVAELHRTAEPMFPEPMFAKPLLPETQLVAEKATPMISAEELKAKLNNNEMVTIIDVRGSEGYAAARTTIKGAWHFKLRRLKSRFKFAPLKDLPKDREIVTYCACPKDESSISAAQIFQEAGFKRVKVLQGGWNEWIRNNGPVQPK